MPLEFSIQGSFLLHFLPLAPGHAQSGAGEYASLVGGSILNAWVQGFLHHKEYDVPEISPKRFGLLVCGQFLTRISSLNRKDDRAQFLVK